jgi:porin
MTWSRLTFVCFSSLLSIDLALAENEASLDAIQEPSLWQRETLTGDWGGLRSRLTDLGVDFSPVLTAEVMGNVTGGINDSGTVYDHCLNLPLMVDLEKLAGWRATSFYANVLWIAGDSLSAKHVGDIANASNLSADPAFRLQELWIEQCYLEHRLSLQAGLIAADAQFFISDAATLFINGTFGAFTLVGANLSNPPIYPMASPGFRLHIEPAENFYLQAAVFDGDTGSQDENPYGSDFPLSTSDGALIVSEIGCKFSGGETMPLVTTLKAGSFFHTKQQPSWDSRIAGSGSGGRANFGIYGVFEQGLLRWKGRTITVFFRGGYAPARLNTVDWYMDGGFNFTGLIPGRADDVAGIAVAYSHFSHAYRRYEQAVNNLSTHDREMIIEATYRAQITPWWTIQPDFQCVITPAGSCSCDNALIIALRTTVAF